LSGKAEFVVLHARFLRQSKDLGVELFVHEPSQVKLVLGSLIRHAHIIA
jgi:hypothetical protein